MLNTYKINSCVDYIDKVMSACKSKRNTLQTRCDLIKAFLSPNPKKWDSMCSEELETMSETFCVAVDSAELKYPGVLELALECLCGMYEDRMYEQQRVLGDI